MTKIRGKNADFSIGSAVLADGSTPGTHIGPFTEAGAVTMVRIETLSNEVSLSIETTTVDSSAYGDDFDQFESVTYRWSVEVSAYFQPDATPNTESLLMSAILNLGKYPFIFWPNNFNATPSPSQPEYSGKVIIENVSVNPVRAGLSMLRCRLRGDGQLHRAVA